MNTLFSVDWNLLFVPDTSILEIIIRGTVLYMAIFFIIRFIPNRQIGVVGMNDMLLIVLVASAATNSLAGNHTSITNGIVLVATVIFWSYAFNWAGHRFPSLQRVFQPKPELLVKDGEMQRENMRKELITEEELIGELRRSGTNDVKTVREAYVESDGKISVVQQESN